MPNLPWWSNLLAALVALIPALLSAWWGRALVRMQEDAAIGERLLAHRRRILRLTIIAAVILAICVPRTLIWSLPLLILFRAIAAFPVRRALFGETWNLAKYLLGGFRLYLALLGFWILWLPARF